MLIRLVYVSRAHSPLPLELKEILAVSRKNNPGLGVTGAMCFLDGVYLQYLEGEAQTLDMLYQRIKVDPRHTEPVVIERCAIEKRTFLTWSMALLTWNEETRAIFRNFTPDSEPDLYKLDASTVSATFFALACTRNWMVV